jgi:hypothetical protein
MEAPYPTLAALIEALQAPREGRRAYGYVAGQVRVAIRGFAEADEARVQDVTQATLLRLTLIGEDRRAGQVGAWVRAVAVNIMRDLARRRGRWRDAEGAARRGVLDAAGWAEGTRSLAGSAPEAVLAGRLEHVTRQGLEAMARAEPGSLYLRRARQLIDLQVGRSTRQDILQTERSEGAEVNMRELSRQLSYAREKLVPYIGAAVSPEAAEAMKELLVDRMSKPRRRILPRPPDGEDEALMEPP